MELLAGCAQGFGFFWIPRPLGRSKKYIRLGVHPPWGSKLYTMGGYLNPELGELYLCACFGVQAVPPLVRHGEPQHPGVGASGRNQWPCENSIKDAVTGRCFSQKWPVKVLSQTPWRIQTLHEPLGSRS